MGQAETYCIVDRDGDQGTVCAGTYSVVLVSWRRPRKMGTDADERGHMGRKVDQELKVNLFR